MRGKKDKQVGGGNVALRATALVAAGSLLLGACGTEEGQEADDVDEAAVDESDGSEDAEIDYLVFALTPPDPVTNRHWATGAPGQVQLEPYMERLLGNDVDTAETVPELAVDWEPNDDFTEWTFYLREGVQFHHGWGEFTSEDVVHTIELLGREESVLAYAEVWATATAEAIDTHEVVVRFEEPQILAEDYFSGAIPDGFIHSKAQWDEEGLDGIDNQPAGTGHYVYDSRADGEWIRFTRNDSHWSGEQAEFEGLEFRWEPEDSTRLARVLSGEAHIADIGRELHPQAEESGLQLVRSNVENHQSWVAFTGLSYGEQGYEPNTDYPWVDDARVRGALNMALNRDDILEFIYEGDADPLVAVGRAESMEGWSQAWVDDWEDYYGYDPDRALELIEEAGYSPEDIAPTLWSFTIAGSPEWPLLLEFIQGQWEAIGVRATIEETQFDTVRDLLADREAAEGHLYPMRNMPIRQPQIFHQGFMEADSRYGMFNTPKAEELWPQWSSSADLDEREELAIQIGDEQYYEWATIPIAQFGAAIVVDPAVVAGWDFPGVTSASMTHWELIQAAS